VGLAAVHSNGQTVTLLYIGFYMLCSCSTPCSLSEHCILGKQQQIASLQQAAA
jgi:hypothetical protein